MAERGFQEEDHSFIWKLGLDCGHDKNRNKTITVKGSSKNLLSANIFANIISIATSANFKIKIISYKTILASGELDFVRFLQYLYINYYI